MVRGLAASCFFCCCGIRTTVPTIQRPSNWGASHPLVVAASNGCPSAIGKQISGQSPSPALARLLFQIGLGWLNLMRAIDSDGIFSDSDETWCRCSLDRSWRVVLAPGKKAMPRRLRSPRGRHMPGLRKSQTSKALAPPRPRSTKHRSCLGPHERTPSWEGQDVFTVCDVPPFPKSLTPTYQTLLTRMKSFQSGRIRSLGSVQLRP